MRCISDDMIQKYIDNETSSKENSIVQNHLATCSKCAKKVEDSRNSANRIKELIGSLNKDEIQVPVFKEPENHKKTFSIHYKKVFYVAAVACLVIIFFLIQQKPKDEIECVYSYDLESEYNANLPVSEQEMVIEIIDSEGNLIKY
jgi:hypothetical protein